MWSYVYSEPLKLFYLSVVCLFSAIKVFLPFSRMSVLCHHSFFTVRSNVFSLPSKLYYRSVECLFSAIKALSPFGRMPVLCHHSFFTIRSNVFSLPSKLFYRSGHMSILSHYRINHTDLILSRQTSKMRRIRNNIFKIALRCN